MIAFFQRKIKSSGVARRLSVCLSMLLLVSSCTFEKQTFQDKPDTTITLSKDIWVHNPGTKTRLYKGTSVRVLAKYAEDREDGYIIETPDGERYTTTYLEDIKGIPEKYVNILHTYYVKDLLKKGQSISSFIEQWGDYTEYTASWAGDTEKRAYVFPQVSEVSKGQVSQGSRVITDQNGLVIDIYPGIEGHKNAFGKLPFFEEIIALNLQNAVKAPYLVSSPDEATQEMGIVLGTIWGLIWLLFLLAPVSLLALIGFHLLQDYTRLPLPVLMGIVIAVSAIVIYPLLLVIFNECHSVWWLLAVMASSLAGIYTAIYSTGRRQCPVCHSYKWDIKEEQDYDRSNIKIKYPFVTFSRDANNDIVTDVSFRKVTQYPFDQTFTCRVCGKRIYDVTYKDSVKYENNCPKCGTKKDTRFYRVKITADYDTKVKGTYTEHCPKCGYTYATDFEASIQGRRILETAAPKKRDNDNQPERGEEYKNDCRHCKYFHHNTENSCTHDMDKARNGYRTSRTYSCPYWEFDGLD